MGQLEQENAAEAAAASAEQKQSTSQPLPLTLPPSPLSTPAASSSEPIHYPGASVPWQHGWRLVLVIFTLFSGLFLSTLETTIIATALVNISAELGSFQKSNWIPVAYLLTYTGFLIIFARLSDIFGRKQMLIFSVTFFMIFCGACGAAQTMVQLIVLRAFQGIGGGGIYSCVMGTLREVSPPNTFGNVIGLMGVVFAVSSIMGPVLGGAIVASSTWRWVFLLNLPPCVIIIALLAIFFPSDIEKKDGRLVQLRQVDFIGVVLSLAASSCLIYGLEAGSLSSTWASADIVSTLTVGSILWVAFILWQIYLDRPISSAAETTPLEMKPIFPVRLVKHRVIAASMAAGFFAGFAFFVIIVSLPQKFQIENGLAPDQASVRLIPLLVMSAAGASVTGQLCARKAWEFYILLSACGLQIIALGLLSSQYSSSIKIQPVIYGCEILMGFGLGSFNTCIILIARSAVSGRDQAVTVGAITQARTLGGIIGLAVSQVVLFRRLISTLRDQLRPRELLDFLDLADVNALPAGLRALVRIEYGRTFAEQMRVIMYFTIVAFVAGCCAWRKNAMTFDQINAERMRSEREAKEREQEQQNIQAAESSIRCSTSSLVVAGEGGTVLEEKKWKDGADLESQTG